MRISTKIRLESFVWLMGLTSTMPVLSFSVLLVRLSVGATLGHCGGSIERLVEEAQIVSCIIISDCHSMHLSIYLSVNFHKTHGGFIFL